MRMVWWAMCVLVAGSSCAPSPSPAARTEPLASAPASRPGAARDSRWERQIREFEEADRTNAPPRDAVVFVGSSSIRGWKGLAYDFPACPVINRGFGGSSIADCTRYVDRIVVPCRPRMVVLYAGDNDIAGGRSAQRVFEDYKAFVREVRRKLPGIRVAFISIKPSPARVAHLGTVRQANELIRGYAAENEGLDYIDVFGPMLAPDGKPRAELFGPDRLHMNRQGYDLWKAIVAPHLK